MEKAIKSNNLILKYILLGLLAAALKFAFNFVNEGFADSLIGPLMGIFAGVPGIIGCTVGSFVFELIFGETFLRAVLFIIPTIIVSLIPFLSRRYLKDKNSFTTAWIYLLVLFVTFAASSLVWAIITTALSFQYTFGTIFIALGIPMFSISFAIGYPVFFLIRSIKEHSFKTGKTLLNVFIWWMPIQYIVCVFLASKVYSINLMPQADVVLFNQDWFFVSIYIIIMNITMLLLATLTTSHKRVMLFVYAGIMLAASVYNIVTFDTGEGLYVFIFLTLWLLLHAIFFMWYEEKALKVKAVKIITNVLLYILLICFVLTTALSAATLIIPEAKGTENHLIVLGAPVRNDKATSILEDRINVASDYMNSNKDSSAILTGGTKVEGGKTEAEVIRDGLVKNGISDSRVILESDAKTTQENFEKCLEIIEGLGGSADDKIVIITSAFHLLRSGIYARRAGFNNLTYKGAYPFIFKDWVWTLREVFSLIPLLFQ